MDNNNNLWIGTDTGELFKCDLYLNSIKKIKNIPYFSNINKAYYDQYGEWWISANDNISLYDDSFTLNKDIFLLHWNEEINEWSYFQNDLAPKISSADITSILRSMNNLYVGTNKGLLKYKMNKDEWIFLKDNTLNYYVYSVLKIKDLIYVATNKGLKIFSETNDFIIKKDIISRFDTYAIRDLAVIDNRLYFVADIGLFEYNLDENHVSKISDISYSMIVTDSEKNLYVSKKNRLFRINQNNIDYLANIKTMKNMCFCNNFIWINNSKYASVLNLFNNDIVEYDALDGLLSKKIYDIQCDDDWVWFSTDNGLVLYNWSKYHNNNE